MTALTLSDIISQAESLGSARTKKQYISQGAVEPLFGNTITSLKPIAKKLLKQDNTQDLAFELYNTGNYDLMYLAGMIVDPTLMTKADFDGWMTKAYFHMISDYIIAVSLSEVDIAQEVADAWILSSEDLYKSAGYSTYSWKIASSPDTLFNKNNLLKMLNTVEATIHDASGRAKYSMYYFLYNVGVSYTPLHEEAMAVANRIGDVTIIDAKEKTRTYSASKEIMKQVDKGKLGFKRRNVRC